VDSLKQEGRAVSIASADTISAAKEEAAKVIAENLKMQPATVSKWRIGFAENGVAVL
jgi:hypothetical protein